MDPLDQHLADSALPVPIRSVQLRREIDLVIAEAERLARPNSQQLRRRLGVSWLAAIGALTVGAAAAGAGGILPWYQDAPLNGSIVTSTGSTCALTFGIKGVEVGNRPVADATRASAVAVAEQYLADLDVSSIDVAAATAKLPPRVTENSEEAMAETVDDYEARAVQAAVQRGVDAELDARSLPTSATSVSMASSCEGGDE
ncbi:hypothetical protein [Aeromicrobium sp.]|uniref:hypothetical protein n=1 Tax=Aeromicrobium sp. TaxID=1871063 RepID=UPI003C4710E8